MAISLHKILQMVESEDTLNKTKHSLGHLTRLKNYATLYPDLSEREVGIFGSQDEYSMGATNRVQFVEFDGSIFWVLICFGFLGIFVALLVLLIGVFQRDQECDLDECDFEECTDKKKESMGLLETK